MINGKSIVTSPSSPKKTPQQITNELLLALSTAKRYEESTCGKRIINAINRYLRLTHDTDRKSGERFANTATDALSCLESVYQEAKVDPGAPQSIDGIIGRETHYAESEHEIHREIASDLKREYAARQVSTECMKEIEKTPAYRLTSYVISLENQVTQAGK